MNKVHFFPKRNFTEDAGTRHDAIEGAVLFDLPLVSCSNVNVGNVHLSEERNIDEDHTGHQNPKVLSIGARTSLQGRDDGVTDVIQAEGIAILERKIICQKIAKFFIGF